MSSLICSINKIFKYKKLISVFGISSDKEIRFVSSILDTFSDIIILTKAKNNTRAEEVNRLKKYFQSSKLGLKESSDIDEAIQKALKLADKDDLIVITGSLFVVGDAMRYFKTA